MLSHERRTQILTKVAQAIHGWGAMKGRSKFAPKDEFGDKSVRFHGVKRKLGIEGLPDRGGKLGLSLGIDPRGPGKSKTTAKPGYAGVPQRSGSVVRRGSTAGISARGSYGAGPGPPGGTLVGPLKAKTDAGKQQASPKVPKVKMPKLKFSF
jgi:hypothetical protein